MRRATEPVWTPLRRSVVKLMPDNLRAWLTGSDSLTQRLRLACGSDFNVRVQGQSWCRPSENERQILTMRPAEYGFTREVVLACGDQPWVFARTVMPRATLSGRRRRLMCLGNKPLGELLFTERAVTRGELQIARLRPEHALFKRIETQLKGVDMQDVDELWGRRSVFQYNAYPLMVSEWFLPDIGQCLRSSASMKYESMSNHMPASIPGSIPGSILDLSSELVI